MEMEEDFRFSAVWAQKSSPGWVRSAWSDLGRCPLSPKLFFPRRVV